MKSFEQMVQETIAGLSVRDQRLVQAWRDLGNSPVTSLVNSGVLTSNWRAYPDPAARVYEFHRRLALPDAAMKRRMAAEHEAAHAVVADALGCRVRSVTLSEDGQGDSECMYEKAATSHDRAAVALASRVWLEGFRSFEYPGGDLAGCSADWVQVLRSVDSFSIKLAEKRVGQILGERDGMLLELAERLDREGHIDYPFG